MRLVILAAGFANSLPPQTLTRPKSLVPVAERTLLDRLIDNLLPIGALKDIWVVSNRRFAPQFESWAREREAGDGPPIRVLDDGSSSETEALGALGDLRLVLDRCGTGEDLVVAADDNLLSQSLETFGDYCREVRAPVLAVYDVGRLEDARRYSAVHIDMENRITSFVEKPQAPDTTLIGIALYYYPQALLPRIAALLEASDPKGRLGELVQWLYPRQEVYTWAIPGIWFDIDSPEILDEADRIFRGLSPRQPSEPSRGTG